MNTTRTAEWHPNLNDAYRAAHLVCQGKCAAFVAQEIFEDKTPKEIGHVARLLRFAVEKGILRLTCPTNEGLAHKLSEAFDGQIAFFVVNNEMESDGELQRLAVCQQAATVISERISALLAQQRGPDRPLIIGNAGGPAVRSMIRSLAGRAIINEEANTKRLLFLSLNSASIPTNYDYSANTLAVHMAEIYSGQHIALSPIWPQEVKAKYDNAIRNLDLLVCGAGTREGLFFTWYKKQVGIDLPPSAVGDICLVPIAEDGSDVPLTAKSAALIKQHLRPSPCYKDLQALGARDGVILVVLGQQSDELNSEQRPPGFKFHSKLQVTRAILKRRLARTCVLGSSLAAELLRGDLEKDPR